MRGIHPAEREVIAKHSCAVEINAALTAPSERTLSINVCRMNEWTASCLRGPTGEYGKDLEISGVGFLSLFGPRSLVRHIFREQASGQGPQSIDATASKNLSTGNWSGWIWISLDGASLLGCLGWPGAECWGWSGALCSPHGDYSPRQTTSE